MNKTDLTNEIAAKAGLSKADAKKALDATLESIAQALVNEDKVQLIGFGTFAVVAKEARTGINPRTKEKIGFFVSMRFQSCRFAASNLLCDRKVLILRSIYY